MILSMATLKNNYMPLMASDSTAILVTPIDDRLDIYGAEAKHTVEAKLGIYRVTRQLGTPFYTEPLRPRYRPVDRVETAPDLLT